MKLSLSFILCCVLLSGCQSFNKNSSSRAKSVQNTTRAAHQKSKLNTNEKWLSKASIYQELTGQKINSQQVGVKLLKMAELAQSEKNYILALKRYNTVIARFPQSKLAQFALFGKADLYKKMGLSQQADYNTRLARDYRVVAKATPKVASALIAKKPIASKKTFTVRKMASGQKTGTKK